MDYTLALIPLAAVGVLVLGFVLLFSDHTSQSLWGFSLLLGLVTIIGIAYYFLDSQTTIALDEDVMLALGDVSNIPETGSAFIALGYWVSVVGMVITVLTPLVALTLPQPQPEI